MAQTYGIQGVGYGEPSGRYGLLVFFSPSNLTADTITGTDIDWSWDEVAEADAYDFEFEEWDGVEWQPHTYVTDIVTTEHTTSDLDPDTTYRARVYSVAYS